MVEIPVWLMYSAAAAILAVLPRRQIARLLTPPGIPGVPNIPGTLPIIGDISTMAKLAIRDGESSYGLGALAKELGPVYLLRVSWIYRYVHLHPAVGDRRGNSKRR